MAKTPAIAVAVVLPRSASPAAFQGCCVVCGAPAAERTVFAV